MSKKNRPFQPAFIGICAACLAAQTFFILEKQAVFSNQYPLFIGLLTVFGYHFISKSSLKKAVGWIAGIAAVVIFLENKWPLGGLPIGLFALAASYYFPVVRRLFFGKNAPLRASTFGKPILIGFVWAVVTVVPPFLFFEKTGRSPALFLMLAERFCFVAALALAYDLLDENADRAAGLATIPVRFGAVFTKKSMVFLLFVAMLAAAGQVVSGLYSVKIGAAVVFSLFVSAFLTLNLPKNWPAAGAKMLVDTAMVGQFLGVAASI